ncbi:hypothetical protein AB434_0435 [Heyndrickxia coagulans]|uniref:Uncharacterized protein n=1 Tax=Heyndrickxia coagulans TaxID=1398 RepID=A0AAN0T2M0_HEYCO|nr:hypothetical protein SB48_HM08orf01142 [Heyndrickxia coagulans]AKN52840.1 hypothetical protein AB434_0435 [Heyndrickxia coagulans]KYC84052.1 hypothetical protein B4096_1979 [Heyndrickxia coagulans]
MGDKWPVFRESLTCIQCEVRFFLDGHFLEQAFKASVFS